MSSAQELHEERNPCSASPAQLAPSRLRTAWIVRVSIAVVLLTHAALLLDCSRKNFVTVDEAGHLVAGISHWTTGTYSMYRVNPPLARILAVVPVFLLHPNTKGIQPVLGPAKRAEWPCANQFALDNDERYLDILLLARLAGILWSCLGGWLVYRWGTDLYSSRAGLLGLVLWCFDPNILAHAQMVTPDVPATVAGLAACYCFWRYLRQPSWSSALLTGIVLGISQLTKFTLLYLYVFWPLLWLVKHWGSRATGKPGIPFWRQVRQGLGIAAVSILVINMGYEFQDTGKPLGEYIFVSRTLGGEPLSDISPAISPVNRFQNSFLGALPIPLPTEFLAGIDRQRFDFEHGWPSYLRGQWQPRGWWYYYLYGLTVKMPLGALFLIVWGLILTLIGHPCRGWFVDECFVWLPVLAILALISSQTGFNHHLRYVLPLFPFAFLGAGKLAYFLSPQHWKTGLLVLFLVLWSMVNTLAIHPHYLSYFNQAAGGPENGHNHLLNSNISWGQDLLFLKAWLDQHPEARPFGLAYFNVIDPKVVGIDFPLPPPGSPSAAAVRGTPVSEVGPLPGYYALDVNFICGAASFANGMGRSYWVQSQEFEYFQHFQPIAKAGYSIFIYHITLEEANRFRRERGLPLLTE